LEAAPRLNLAQLVNRVGGKIDKLHDPAVANLGRFIHSLDQDGDIEKGVRIAPAVHELIGSAPINFSPPPMPIGQGGAFDFSNEPTARRILDTLNATNGVFTAQNAPHALRCCHHPPTNCGAISAASSRRRIVRIPLRDGSYVCADVFRPAASAVIPS